MAVLGRFGRVLPLFLASLTVLGSGKPFSVSEEKMPVAVREKLEAIRAAIAIEPGDSESIPLLDPKVDWNEFANWPRQFRFHGIEYHLAVIRHARFSDQLSIWRRIFPGRRAILAGYLSKDEQRHFGDASWAADGTLRRKRFVGEGNEGFDLEYYFDGALFCFGSDFKGGEMAHRFEFYGRNGVVCATRVLTGRDLKGECKWAGEVIGIEEFQRRCNAMRWSAAYQPFTSNQEVMPTGVREEIQARIEAAFGAANLKGLPLLDPDIDWTRIENWPDEFVFEGVTNRIRLAAQHADVSTPITDRNAAGPGVAFAAWYRTLGGEAGERLLLSANWNPGGGLQSEFVSYHGRVVFSLKFYPDGHLHSISMLGFETWSRSERVFDWHGTLRGIRQFREDELPIAVWNGNTVSGKTWTRNVRHLWDQGAGELAW